MTKKIISLISFYIILSSNIVFSQSVGLTFESNSFNVSNFFFFNVPARGKIKNVFVQTTLPVLKPVHVSLKAGYGWNSFSNTSQQVSPSYYNNSQTITTKGIPVELSLFYSKYVSSDSVFEPFLSIGVGYYNYKTVNRNDYTGTVEETEYKTKGFCGLVSFGLNIYATKKLLTFIEFKNYVLNGLKTSWETLNQTERYKIENDYASSDGSLNLSVSIGMLYEL